MATIIPARQRDGDHRTGTLPALVPPARIIRVLGFGANAGPSADGKTELCWSFTVDGRYASIWDYRDRRWSVFDPDDVLPALFGLEPTTLEREAAAQLQHLVQPAPADAPAKYRPALQLRLF